MLLPAAGRDDGNLLRSSGKAIHHALGILGRILSNVKRRGRRDVFPLYLSLVLLTPSPRAGSFQLLQIDRQETVVW